MSLVQEALDKIQEKRFGKESLRAKGAAAIPNMAPAMAGSQPVKKHASLPVPAAGVAVAVVAVALLFVFVLFGTNSGESPKKAEPARLPVEVKQNVIYRPMTPVNKEGPGAMQAVMAPVIEAMTRSSLSGMPKLVLSGIMYIEGDPRAIVNGYTISEGDFVSGAVLKEIRENSVIFTSNGVEITISLD